MANTPNLSGRFPLAVSNNHSLGSTGGSETHTLKQSETPLKSHTHTVAASGSHKHGIGRYDVGVDNDTNRYVASIHPDGDWYESGINDALRTSENGSHTHELSAASNESASAHNNMPPFYSLYFIIKAY